MKLGAISSFKPTIRVAVLLIAGTFGTPAAGQAIRAPTDLELRSFYCSSVLKSQKAELSSGLATTPESDSKPASVPQEVSEYVIQQRAEAQALLIKITSAQERIRAYLLPRLMELEPTSLLLADKRARDDKAAFEAMIGRCLDKCTDADQRAAKACYSNCVDNDLIERIRSCLSPTWLPF